VPLVVRSAEAGDAVAQALIEVAASQPVVEALRAGRSD
jgi:hypothetical protein